MNKTEFLHRLAQQVPSNTFIDKAHFGSYDDLYKYLSGMGEAEYQKYLDAIRNFIQSPKIKPFTAEAFAEYFTKAFITSEN